MEKVNHQIRLVVFAILFGLFPVSLSSQTLIKNPELDNKVKAFLEKHKNQWYDMNVPGIDGQLLFDIITENDYKSALEIGTSTGHSGIWIAWALSKTGGCFTAYNISERQSRYSSGQGEFLNYIKGLSNYETTVNSSGGGVSISYKKAK